MGNLTRADYPDDSFVDYTYDANGRLTSAAESGDGVAVSFEYDVMNNVTRMACPYLDRTVVYTYDSGGRLTAVTVKADNTADYATTYAYADADGDDGFVTAAVRQWDGINIDAPGTTFAYDAAGRVSAIDYHNGIAETHSYDPMGMVETIKFSGPRPCTSSSTTSTTVPATSNGSIGARPAPHTPTMRSTV